MCIVLPCSIYSLDDDPDSKPPCLIICRIYIRTLANGGWRRTRMCSAGECGNIALFHMSAHSKRKAKWRGMMAPFPQRDPTGAFSVSVWLSMRTWSQTWQCTCMITYPRRLQKNHHSQLPAQWITEWDFNYTSTFSLVPQFAYPAIPHRCELWAYLVSCLS